MNVGVRRHGEDVIKLLQRALFGLRHQAKDHDQRGQIQSCVEAERSDRMEGTQKARERD